MNAEYESDDKSLWRGKFASLKEYYLQKYPAPYYEFDEYQLEIDPDETLEDFNAYDSDRQRLELAKCAWSFPYFATKYLRIFHPTKGLLPFIQYKYQKKVIANYEKRRFNMLSKFRQGGLTTLTELWGLWRCLFEMDQKIMLVSKTDREAIAAGEIINTAVKNLPNWIKPSPDGKWNDHHKQFSVTNCNMYFFSPEAARGHGLTYLIIDEAAFIPEMDKHWKALYPTLSTGGNCIVISTVCGYGNWYERTYHKSKKKGKPFHIIDLDYWEHPDYNNPEWKSEMISQLGEKGWRQEVLRDFLGSGDTYIPGDIISELTESTRLTEPRRRKFGKWENKEALRDEESAAVDKERGALWIWREPQDGRDYIISIDGAAGKGEDGDNTCIEIIDQTSAEQIAEFYSNCIPAHISAQIAAELGMYYNNAIIVVEEMGAGGTILNNLQNVLLYDHLYYDVKSRGGRSSKPGFKTNMYNRPIILENLQRRLINRSFKVNSSRLVKELNTFIFTSKNDKSKVQAQVGSHDDAIIAISLALWVRDSMLRDIPMGADVPKEMEQPFIATVYEDIKREIMEDAPKRFASSDSLSIFDEDGEQEGYKGANFNVRRKLDKLLKEFAW